MFKLRRSSSALIHQQVLSDSSNIHLRNPRIDRLATRRYPKNVNIERKKSEARVGRIETKPRLSEISLGHTFHHRSTPGIWILPRRFCSFVAARSRFLERITSRQVSKATTSTKYVISGRDLPISCTFYRVDPLWPIEQLAHYESSPDQLLIAIAHQPAYQPSSHIRRKFPPISIKVDGRNTRLRSATIGTIRERSLPKISRVTRLSLANGETCGSRLYVVSAVHAREQARWTERGGCVAHGVVGTVCALCKIHNFVGILGARSRRGNPSKDRGHTGRDSYRRKVDSPLGHWPLAGLAGSVNHPVGRCL